MRVIRTEMFFDQISTGSRASDAAKANPGVSVAFFGGAIERQPVLVELLFSRRQFVTSNNDPNIGKFLDFSLRGIENSFRFQSSRYLREGLRHQEEVRYILDANIVIEESPPHWETLKALLAKSSGVAIGTYAGIELAASNPELMIFTNPAGIVVVGSAIGVSKALAKGLNKKIASLFNDGPRRT
jgi:hypothetical protein